MSMIAEHQRQWKILVDQLGRGQLAHAYIFSGPRETNKEILAKEFIEYLNCTEADKPCHVCNACQLIEKENYPDVRTVKVGPEKEEIEIKQVRDLQSFLSYKAYYGNYKAVIVEDADRMTLEAQNSFLKTLEEPKGKTVIFLLSSQPERMLPTILSRCQQVKFFHTGTYAIEKIDEKIASDLKKLLGSSLAEKFMYAKKTNFEGNDFQRMLSVIQRFFRNGLHQKLGLGTPDGNLEKYSIKKIQKIIELTENLRFQLLQTNLNKKLALEIVLMEI